MKSPRMKRGVTIPKPCKVGASVSVDQISFGGGMYDTGEEDGMQFDVGAYWSEGATELGVQYGANQAKEGLIKSRVP